MHPMLNIAVKAARRAGSIINRAALEGALEVRAKNRNDFVTQVDRAAEQAVIDHSTPTNPRPVDKAAYEALYRAAMG